MKPLVRMLLALTFFGFAGPTLSQEESDEDLERLPLAALLVGDGNYERARQVLAAVDLEDPELDRVRYHTLNGLIALNLNELPMAVREFRSAIDAGQTEPLIWLYMAQAYFGQQMYTETLAALEAAGEEATRLPSVFLMRAQAHWELDEYAEAWDIFNRGLALFPDRASEFARRQVFLLVDQGLYQQAADQGRQFLETESATTQDAIAIGNALRQAGQLDEAAEILERVRLTAPENVTLARVLAHTYLAQDKPLAAAHLLRDAAVYDPELVGEAAELFRRAGWLMQALTLNSQIIDQTAKLKQRLAILIALKRYEQAAGMHQDLARVGLIEDEDIRYAVAYAYFKVGDFDRAEEQLSRLERSDLFRKATELRRVMSQCADEPWLCG
jgi:tetratricopeptide (TPR) repeat protein